ncbi:MarR family transcriptional regulator [Mycobacterium eburneum]|nr:MarR family transcriptional regulator [Mycobacterium eburneum]
MRAFQSSSLQRHSIQFAEWMTHASLEQSRHRGHTRMRPAYARLLIYLDWDGSRISDLARALDVSKNAVGQVVSEMEELGYVERVPDPADGRAKIVRYTAYGLTLLADALDIGSVLDAEIVRVIGAKRFGQLCAILADLCAELPPSDRLPSENGNGQEPQNHPQRR